MKEEITIDKLVALGFTGRNDFMWKDNIGINIINGEYYLAVKCISNTKYITFRKLKSVQDLEIVYLALECKLLIK